MMLHHQKKRNNNNNNKHIYNIYKILIYYPMNI